MVKAGVITIGDELVQGFTQDKNASWIASYLLSENIKIKRIDTIGDNKNDIIFSLDNFIQDRSIKYIIMTGGLGPTHDDITKSVLREYFNSKVYIIDSYMQDLKNKYLKNNIPTSDMLESQASILECSKPIINDVGSALGMIIKSNDTDIIVLPGVPSEMKAMLKKVEFNGLGKLSYVTLKTTGVFESKLYELLKSLIQENNQKFNLSFLPKYTGVNIRISKINNIASDKDFIDFNNMIVEKIGKYVYSQKDESLEEVVSEMLVEKNLSISVAESCTGGLISKKLTEVNGASKYYLGGIVAYSNEVKINVLKVNQNVIEKYGAVSSEVAEQMARGIKNITGSNISIATTGISGPTGGSVDKPVGLIYVAILIENNMTIKKFNLYPKRTFHREIASVVCLNILRLLLKK